MRNPIETVVVCTGSALASLPLLLVMAYVVLGRQKRARELKSYVKPSVKTTDVLAQAPGAQPPGEPLATYLERRYLETHSVAAYATALAVFYVAFGVLLYWSFFAWGHQLTTTKDEALGSESLWEVVRIGGGGALGAILSAIWHLHWRVIRLDLQPKTLLHLSARLCVAPFIALALVTLLQIKSTNSTVVAFCAGLFGDDALLRVRWLWHKLMSVKVKDAYLPLRLIQGISPDDELRLWEEGITDGEHLAVETVIHLITNTNYSLERIVDWKDQAFLYAHVGKDIERWREHHVRGALDVLGMAAKYYGVEPKKALLGALSKTLGTDSIVLDRLVDTISNDPQVNQLWGYVVSAYPSKPAEPLS